MGQSAGVLSFPHPTHSSLSPKVLNGVDPLLGRCQGFKVKEPHTQPLPHEGTWLELCVCVGAGGGNKTKRESPGHHEPLAQFQRAFWKQLRSEVGAGQEMNRRKGASEREKRNCNGPGVGGVRERDPKFNRADSY